jgi:4-amino-4-deoxy-L-arabinose transferase-like glycosyltransferase
VAPTQSLKPFALLIAVLALLGGWRWWVGAALPLSVDEAYYYAWSLTPDWGYWTKPPLIAWAIGTADALCGPTTACVRGVGVLAFSATSLLVYALSRSMGLGAARSLACGIGFATLPLTTFYGMVASTDSMLLLCWVLCMTCLWQALSGRAWGWWGLGLFAGLGLLGKYSMAVVAPSVVLVLLHPAWRQHWRRPGPYVAAGVAALVFAPNLWWNLTHGMPTLQHTAEISRGAAYSLKPDTLLAFLAEQWVVGNVVLVSAFVVWLVRGHWRGVPRHWFLISFSVPMLMVISTQALLSRAHANWAAPAHAALTLAAVGWLWQTRRRAWLGVALGFNLLFAVLLYHGQTLVREPLGLQASWRTDPFWSLRNWPGVHELTRSRLNTVAPQGNWRIASDDRAVLAQLQWGLKLPAGAAMGWLKSGVPMNHFDQRFPLTLTHGPVLLLTRSGDQDVLQAYPQAQKLPPVRSALVESEAIELNAWWLTAP